MKHLRIATIIIGILSVGAVQADVIVAPAHDNIGGILSGGVTGLLVGGFTGGPLGALAGAGIGAFAGQRAQEAAGLSQRAYLIKSENGEQSLVRSPSREFAMGQQVRQESGRLYSAE